MVGLYGLIAAVRGFEGERQYLCEFNDTSKGVRFRIDSSNKIKPVDPWGEQFVHSNLGDLARSQIWRSDPMRPGVGLAYLRKTELTSPATGREYYLLVSVLRLDERSAPRSDVLVDLVHGTSMGEPEPFPQGRGLQPDQALRLPFVLGAGGERLALSNTFSPESAALKREISRVGLTSPDRWTEAERQQVEKWKRCPHVGYIIKNYLEPDEGFIEFAREMSQHQLPTNRLITAEELRDHDDLSNRIIVRQMAAREAQRRPAPIPSSPAPAMGMDG